MTVRIGRSALVLVSLSLASCDADGPIGSKQPVGEGDSADPSGDTDGSDDTDPDTDTAADTDVDTDTDADTDTDVDPEPQLTATLRGTVTVELYEVTPRGDRLAVDIEEAFSPGPTVPSS